MLKKIAEWCPDLAYKNSVWNIIIFLKNSYLFEVQIYPGICFLAGKPKLRFQFSDGSPLSEGCSQESSGDHHTVW